MVLRDRLLRLYLWAACGGAVTRRAARWRRRSAQAAVTSPPQPRDAVRAVRGARAATCLFLAFPLLWLLSMSFKGPRSCSIAPAADPAPPDARQLPRRVHASTGLLHAALNSLKVATVDGDDHDRRSRCPPRTCSRRFRSAAARGVAPGWILLSQMFPLILIIIPLFLLLRDLHLAELAERPRPRLRRLDAAVHPLDAAELRRGHPARPRGGRLGRRREPPAHPDQRRAAAAAPGIVATAPLRVHPGVERVLLRTRPAPDPRQDDAPAHARAVRRHRGHRQARPARRSTVLATIPSLAVFAVIQRRLTSGLLSGAVKG